MPEPTSSRYSTHSGYGVLVSCLKKTETDQFRSHWFKRPVAMFLKDRAPDGPPVSIQLRPEDYPAVIEAYADEIRTPTWHR